MFFWNYDILKWDEYGRKFDHPQRNRFNRCRGLMSTYYNNTIETKTKTLMVPIYSLSLSLYIYIYILYIIYNVFQKINLFYIKINTTTNNVHSSIMMVSTLSSSLLLLSTSTGNNITTTTTTTAICGEERNCGSGNNNKHHTTVCYCHRNVANWINPTTNVYTSNVWVTAVLSQP